MYRQAKTASLAKTVKLLAALTALLGLALPALAAAQPDSARLVGVAYGSGALGGSTGSRVSVRDPESRLHMVYSKNWGNPRAESSEVYHVFSTDDGLTWRELVNVSRMGDSLSTTPCLAVGPDGRLHCVWLQYWGDMNLNPKSDYFYSEYDGEVWSEPENITRRASTTIAAASGSIAVSPAGKVHLAVEYVVPGYSYSILHLARCGDSWTSPVQVSNSSWDDGFPSIAVTSDGRAHVVWRQRRTASGSLLYSRYDSLWTPPRVLAEYLDGVGAVCIAAGVDDRLHVVYTGDARRNAAENYYLTSADGDSWSEPENFSESPLLRTYGATCAVDSIGRVYAVWSDHLDQVSPYYLFFRVRDSIWHPKLQLTTESGWEPRLGTPVRDGRVDLLWLQLLLRPAIAIYYMRLRAPEAHLFEEVVDRSVRSGFLATPNPFTGQTTIRFPVGPGPVSVEVYDPVGRLTRRLGPADLGCGFAVWDGRDDTGRSAGPGVYLVEVSMAKTRVTVLVVKQ